VSKNVTPASSAAFTILVAPFWSAPLPKVMVPRQISETFRPARPRLRYSIHPSVISTGAPKARSGEIIFQYADTVRWKKDLSTPLRSGVGGVTSALR